jgi:hypothetical protein
VKKGRRPLWAAFLYHLAGVRQGTVGRAVLRVHSGIVLGFFNALGDGIPFNNEPLPLSS